MIANLFRSIIVALLIPFTFLCTGMSIFVANSAEMTGTIPSLVPVLCVLVGIVTLCLFLVQLPFLFFKKHWFVTINSLLLGCGFLLWIQANVFNWNFGELDGGGINWAAFRHLMILEIVVYAAVIGLVIWKRRWLNQYVVPLACLLIFMQSAPLARPMANEWISVRTKEEVTSKCPDAEPTLDPNIPAWKQYDITYEGFFDYSPEQNVALIIPDAFSSELFQRMVRKHPEVADWFSDFNYFPKQKSHVSTRLSIPTMLTGKDVGDHRTGEEYDRLLSSHWNSEGALQKTLSEAGFQTRVYAFPVYVYHWDHHWISNIRLRNSSDDRFRKKNKWDAVIETGIGPFTDLTVARSVPIVFKPVDIAQFGPISRFLQSRFASPMTDFMPLQYQPDTFLVQVMADNPASATSPKPVLNVIHFVAAHAPYAFNENFENERMNGIEGEERQAFASLLLLKRLIDGMKEADVYDNTLVVIASDHGNHPLRVAGIVDNSHRHNSLLLVKRQRERHDAMVHRTEYTHIRDIPPTILDLVGLPNPEDRFSVFDMPPDVLAQREVEHEAFWKRQQKYPKLQTVVLKKGEKSGKGGGLEVSSDIALKRSDLHIKDGRLRWYVGDDYDVWNEARSNHEAVIVVTPTNGKGDSWYSGMARFREKDPRGWVSFWSCMGILDIKGIADGDYEVKFLLPKEDGSYAGNVLGTVTVASGTASVVSASSAVASETGTVR